MTGARAVDYWYKRGKTYNYNRSVYSQATGTFTAIVWKQTTHVGIGKATHSNGQRTIVVANYSPPGNIKNQFKQNVLPKRSG